MGAVHSITRRSAQAYVLIWIALLVGGCDASVQGRARHPILGRWRETASGDEWEFLSDGSVVTTSSSVSGGRWAALDDGRYSITLSAPLAGEMITVARIEGEQLVVEFRGHHSSMVRVGEREIQQRATHDDVVGVWGDPVGETIEFLTDNTVVFRTSEQPEEGGPLVLMRRGSGQWRSLGGDRYAATIEFLGDGPRDFSFRLRGDALETQGDSGHTSVLPRTRFPD